MRLELDFRELGFEALSGSTGEEQEHAEKLVSARYEPPGTGTLVSESVRGFLCLASLSD